MNEWQCQAPWQGMTAEKQYGLEGAKSLVSKVKSFSIFQLLILAMFKLQVLGEMGEANRFQCK